MLNSTNKIVGFRILAIDGQAGRVHEVYIDDDQWLVRYLVVETRGWLSGRSVLVDPASLNSIDWETRVIAVNLTRNQVEDSPSIDTHMPVSRRQEIAYVPYATYLACGAMPVVVPADPQTLAALGQRRQTSADHGGDDAHLRSSRAVMGYHIQASDGPIGHVADFLFDDKTWTIRYLIADTRNWLSGKQVLISPQRIRAVNWGDRELCVARTRRQIEESPVYDAEHLPGGEHANASYGPCERAQWISR